MASNLAILRAMSSSRIQLSIVILAYNEEAYIRGCLESVARQTVAPDDVIVVNNNSRDQTVAIAEEFSFVRLINETKQGMIYARNRGFSEAKGELIARIDADSQLPDDWVATVHKSFDLSVGRIAAITGPAYIYDLPNRLMQRLVADVVINSGYFWISRLMLGHQTLFGSNMVVTKEAWLRVKDEVCMDGKKVHEDMDLALHIAQYGDVIFAKNLKVGIAKRALDEPIVKSLHRFWIWPKTVTKHRKLFAKYHPKGSAASR